LTFAGQILEQIKENRNWYGAVVSRWHRYLSDELGIGECMHTHLHFMNQLPMFIMQFIKMHFLIQAIADVERSYDGIGKVVYGNYNAFERQHIKNS
jgi:hypothetical protein